MKKGPYLQDIRAKKEFLYQKHDPKKKTVKS